MFMDEYTGNEDSDVVKGGTTMERLFINEFNDNNDEYVFNPKLSVGMRGYIIHFDNGVSFITKDPVIISNVVRHGTIIIVYFRLVNDWGIVFSMRTCDNDLTHPLNEYCFQDMSTNEVFQIFIKPYRKEYHINRKIKPGDMIKLYGLTYGFDHPILVVDIINGDHETCLRGIYVENNIYWCCTITSSTQDTRTFDILCDGTIFPKVEFSEPDKESVMYEKYVLPHKDGDEKC